MKIRILAVGKLKERYWTEAQAEYAKRLSRFSEIEVVEISEERAPDNASEAQEAQIRQAEAERFRRQFSAKSFVVALDLGGIEPDSVQLSERLQQWMMRGMGEIVFLIGGSTGLDRALSASAHVRMSLSKLTFPHQMARIVLLEQLYRAFKILGNETYHK